MTVGDHASYAGMAVAGMTRHGFGGWVSTMARYTPNASGRPLVYPLSRHPRQRYSGRMSTPPDPAKLSSQLVELRTEHRDLDEAIARLAASIEADELAVKRLKKRKLRIKDMIAYLENQLIPDLDA